MSTGRNWIKLDTRQILDFTRLVDEHLDPVRDDLAAVRAEIMGGGATLGATKVAYTSAAGVLTLSQEGEGVDPDGHRMTADGDGDGWSGVPYPAAAGVTYHLGAKRQVRPSAVTANTLDGLPSYSQEVEAVGELGAASLVADLGDGAGLRLTVLPGLVGAGFAGAATRPAVVWLATPETAGADAIYVGTVAFEAGAYVIEIPHYLGQDPDAPSLDPADYQVLIPGVTVSTTDLAALGGYWYLGTMTDGAWDATDQAVYTGIGPLADAFEAEHDPATGQHTTIDAEAVTLRGSAAGSLVSQLYGALDLAPFVPLAYRADGTPQAVKVRAATDAAPGFPWRIAGTGSGVVGGWYLELPARLPLGQAFQVLGVTVGGSPFDPGDSITVSLVRRAPTAGGVNAGTVLGTWTADFTAISGFAELEADGTALPLEVAAAPEGQSYVWRLHVQEYRIGGMALSHFRTEARASRIEPWS